MSDAPPPSPGSAPLQFETAEPAAGAADALTCASCRQPPASEYYESAGKVICRSCREKVGATLAAPGGHRDLILAAVYGTGAAVAGALLWWGVRALTGYEIGLIAVVVGFAVGFAVRRGSGGRGGRRFQVLAVFLTYTGVALNYVPDVFKALVQPKAPPASQAAAGTAAGTAASGGSPAAPATPEPPGPVAPEARSLGPGGGAPGAAPGPGGPHKTPGAADLLALLALVLALGYAAPFLPGAQNILGLLIIAFALWEAWKINREAHVVFSGPYPVAPAAGAAPNP